MPNRAAKADLCFLFGRFSSARRHSEIRVLTPTIVTLLADFLRTPLAACRSSHYLAYLSEILYRA
jgi:hypothetical protein